MGYFALILDENLDGEDEFLYLYATNSDKAELEKIDKYDPAGGNPTSRTIFRSSSDVIRLEPHNLKNQQDLETVAAHICSVTPR